MLLTFWVLDFFSLFIFLAPSLYLYLSLLFSLYIIGHLSFSLFLSLYIESGTPSESQQGALAFTWIYENYKHRNEHLPE